MDTDQIAALLSGGSEATAQARDALLSGGSGVVWQGATQGEALARIYRRRLGLTRRTGQQTLGLEGAVEELSTYGRSVRLGQITSPDRTWVYMLFLTQDARSLVACTGVRRPTPTAAL